MAALHDALKSLGTVEFSDAPIDNLQSFLSEAFSKGELIVESVPPPDTSATSTNHPATSAIASSASEIALSSARAEPPGADIESLHKEWKPVKLKPAENPLGISVYKCSGKDGKGAWFARRSVHEGLGFTKFKRGLEREFPETLKVQGGPGEGNIRGIGGEKRVVHKEAEGMGKMEVYLLSAQFPGPTTPRDFVTMFLTSENALDGEETPRHFMVISRPCNHPETAPRDGYIRGVYESVEFIREIPTKKKPPVKSKSDINLAKNGSDGGLAKEATMRNAEKMHDKAAHSDSDLTNAVVDENDESEQNPVEWIMVTRSDPGGSVPRFMVERGTPAGIIGDAGKFLDWACGKNLEELDSDDDESAKMEESAGDQEVANEESHHHHHHHHHHEHERVLPNYQTNGHLAGVNENSADPVSKQAEPADEGGIYGMVASAATAAGTMIAAHAPAMIAEHLPASSSADPQPQPPTTTTTTATVHEQVPLARRISSASFSSESTGESFTSALSFNDTASAQTAQAAVAAQKTTLQEDKELQKLEEKKRKLDEKLFRAKQKEAEKKSEDGEKEREAIRKAEEKHQREVKKQEEKYRKEVEKLERKRKKEEAKQEERRRKKEEKERKEKEGSEIEGLKAEVDVLKRERELLKEQLGTSQKENTVLVGLVGGLGEKGQEVMGEFRRMMGHGGRVRTVSGVSRASGSRTSGSRASGSLRNEVGKGSEEAERVGGVVNGVQY